MLENCPKRRMILSLGLLVAVTIVVLIIESRLAGEEPGRRSKIQFVIENNSTCWLREPYTVIEECAPCTDLEILSRSQSVCINTHYKEVLRCKSGETVVKSCDKVALNDQTNFIKFEVFCFIVGVLSFLISYARNRILIRRTHLKIERQLNRIQ